MVAFAQGFPYGGAHYKTLEKDKIEALARSKGDFDQLMQISPKGKEDITWWLSNIKLSGNLIQESKPTLTLFTDASTEGWGAHLGDQTTGGRWAASEKETTLTS